MVAWELGAGGRAGAAELDHVRYQGESMTSFNGLLGPVHGIVAAVGPGSSSCSVLTVHSRSSKRFT